MEMIQLCGIVFSVLFGELLRFAYIKSNKNALAGVFTSVNGSIWEQLKLPAIPMLFYAVFEYFIYGSEIDNFFPVRAASILVAMAATAAICFILRFIPAKTTRAADLASFILGVTAGYVFSYEMFGRHIFISGNAHSAGIAALACIMLLFTVFTFCRPDAAIFKDHRGDRR